jgi:hypothetical protein
MASISRLILFVALIGSSLSAQQQSLTLNAGTPAPIITVSAQSASPFGPGMLCYWVVANFPIGKSGPSMPGCAMNVGATVNINWTPVTGAVSYDLLRTPDVNLPSGSASIALVTAYGTTSFTDSGPASTFAYTVNTAPPATATFLLDNLNQSAPQVRLSINNGLTSTSFALGVVPPVAGVLGSTRTVTNQSEIVICTALCTVNLLVPQFGTQFCVQNDDNVSTQIFIMPPTGVQIENTARTSYKSPSLPLASGGAIGDQLCLVGKDSTHYNVFTFIGTWI